MKQVLINKPKSIKTHKGIYIIFYLIFALFFVICIIELRNNVVVIKGNYKKAYPQLEIQPRIDDGSSKSILIRYDEADMATVDRWIKLIDDFLETYITYSNSLNVASSCDFKHPPKKDQVCPIDMDNLGPCLPPFYGYYSLSPCIFLRLSEIHDWIPDYYNSTDRLPESMPQDLVNEIKNASIKHESNQIWISCEGENDVDKENMEAINYYPGRGFPSYIFPKSNKNKFLSPLIAVEILNPKPGILLSVKCQIWSKNLPHKIVDLERQQGSIRFGIMRDELLFE